MNWFRRDRSPVLPALPAPPVPLKPGTCECSHGRCYHENGTGTCGVAFKPHSEDNDTGNWLYCSCRIFILDDDGDDSPEVPDEPEGVEVSELERIGKL